MSVEMACGSCQGRFVVETAGTVACPHCGAHLAVSADMLGAQDATVSIPAETADSAATDDTAEPTFSGYAGLADTIQTTDQPKPADGPAAADETETENEQRADSVEFPGQPKDGNEIAANVTEQPESDQSSDMPAEMPVFGRSVDEEAANLPDFSELQLGDNSPSAAEAATEMPSFDLEADEATVAFGGFDELGDDTPGAMFAEGESPFDNVDSQRETLEAFPDFGAAAEDNQDNGIEGVLSDAATAATIVEERPVDSGNQSNPETDKPETESSSAPPPQATAAAEASTDHVSRTKFFLLASYASAVTIVCLWLIYQLLTGKHQLENLRDPADAPKTGDKKYVQLFQIDAKMPRGHLLELGESRRFGNILVEPLKVTRGPLAFVPYSSEIATNTTPPDASEIGPTLKLWLKLTNVSGDQTIAPLDSVLLYSNRVRSDDNYEELRGNTFVCRAADKTKDGHLVYVYSLNLNKSWDLRGQDLKELAPGESMETYIAAGPDGIDKLKGDLIWRVHFRKGYSPSGKGVTTLFEVAFRSDDIQGKSAASSKQATASL